MAFAHQMAVDAGIEYEAAKAGPNKYKAPRKMPPIPPEQYQAAIDEAISRYHIPEPPEIEPEQENEHSELQEAESLTEKQNIKEELQINEGYKRMADIGDLCQYFFRHVKALVTIGVLRFRKLKAVNMVVTFFLYDFQWRDQVRMGKGLQKDFIACFEQVLRKRR